MPLGLAELALQIVLAMHAVRSGRTQPWLYIILFIPGLGPILYLVMEVAPELLGGRTGQKVASNVAQAVAPGRVHKALSRQVEIAPTVFNKAALGDECLRLGRGTEALGLFESCAHGLHAADPVVRLGLARARSMTGDWPGAIEAVEAVQRDTPERVTPDIGLLHAAALNGAGRTADALQALKVLADRYPGEEARCRYAQLLEKAGDPAGAVTQYVETVRRVELQKGHYRREQREWYELAKRKLAVQA